MRTLRQLAAAACLLGGLAIVGYAVWSLIDLPGLSFGRHSPYSRDTGACLLLLIIGISVMGSGFHYLEPRKKPPEARGPE